MAKMRSPNYPAYDLQQALNRKSTRLNSSHPSISYAVFCPPPTSTLFPYTTLFRSARIACRLLSSLRLVKDNSEDNLGYITTKDLTSNLALPSMLTVRGVEWRR